MPNLMLSSILREVREMSASVNQRPFDIEMNARDLKRLDDIVSLLNEYGIKV